MLVVSHSPHEDDAGERQSRGDTTARTVTASANFSVDQAEQRRDDQSQDQET